MMEIAIREKINLKEGESNRIKSKYIHELVTKVTIKGILKSGFGGYNTKHENKSGGFSMIIENGANVIINLCDCYFTGDDDCEFAISKLFDGVLVCIKGNTENRTLKFELKNFITGCCTTSFNMANAILYGEKFAESGQITSFCIPEIHIEHIGAI